MTAGHAGTAAPTSETPAAARAAIRAGAHRRPTAGLAPGHVQANLVAVPRADAFDLLRLCVRNPAPCPILDVTAPGEHTTDLAAGADLRTDLPRYRIFSDGELVAEPDDVLDAWPDDLVTILLGCSFTFEWALLAAGLRLAHHDQGVNVPMYVTNRRLRPAGALAGPLVVSMRPFAPADAATAAAITARFPSQHGAPVHAGDPAALGITDLGTPDFGDPVALAPGDVPVFWACGVTPQAVALEARLPLVITHSPGHMLVTDGRHADHEVTA